MTGEDLKRMQDNFLETSKKIIQEEGRLRPMGFVVTLHKHIEKLFESGYGVEFIDPKDCLRDAHDDRVTTLVIDLLMDWKRLYFAVMKVFPQTRGVLPQLLVLGEEVGVDDPYKRIMRPFLEATQMNEKDVIAATMKHICGEVNAFAAILHTEAWLRMIDRRSEDAARIAEEANTKGLAQDQASIEVVLSILEAHDFARTITVPVHRGAPDNPNKRDSGKVLGFGDPTVIPAQMQGRMSGFLKPLEEAS
jgi:hypothetical protein